jgi:hypothetical protein
MSMIRFLFHTRTKCALRKVNLLSGEDRDALRTHGIESAEDFYARMAGNPSLIDSLGLPDADAKKRVVEAMATFAGTRSESITRHPLVEHIPDVIVVVVVLLAAYSLLLLDRTPARPKMAQQVVVTAPKGLPAFRVIRESDVGVRDTAKSSTAIASVDAVLGRYATERLAEGTIIDQAKLSSGPRLSNELDGLRVFAVKLQSSPLLVNLKPPVKVGIMPSPREKYAGSQPSIYDVYILEMRPLSDGVSAVVATSEAHSRHLALFLGRADLIAVGPVH